MQLAVYQLALSLPLPSPLEIVEEEFRKLIEFRTLNPVSLIKVIKPDFSFEDTTADLKDQVILSSKNKSVLEAFMVEISAAIAIVVLILIAMIASLSRKFEMVKLKLHKTFKTLVWNGLLTSFLLTNFKHAMTAGDKIQALWLKNTASAS